jgi:hypothetical protein
LPAPAQPTAASASSTSTQEPLPAPAQPTAASASSTSTQEPLPAPAQPTAASASSTSTQKPLPAPAQSTAAAASSTSTQEPLPAPAQPALVQTSSSVPAFMTECPILLIQKKVHFKVGFLMNLLAFICSHETNTRNGMDHVINDVAAAHDIYINPGKLYLVQTAEQYATCANPMILPRPNYGVLFISCIGRAVDHTLKFILNKKCFDNVCGFQKLGFNSSKCTSLGSNNYVYFSLAAHEARACMSLGSDNWKNSSMYKLFYCLVLLANSMQDDRILLKKTLCLPGNTKEEQMENKENFCFSVKFLNDHGNVVTDLVDCREILATCYSFNEYLKHRAGK